MNCCLKAEFHAPKLATSVGNVIIQGGVDVEPLSVAENGTYAESGKAYSPVIVDVEGIVPTGTLEITENGSYDVTDKAEAAVNVQPPLETATVTPTKQTQTVEPTAPNYGLSRVTVDPIPSEYIIPSGTQSIVQNGQYDITEKAAVDVQVPNSYTASDEGKVVNNGALVAQTSRTVSDNGTYDTTLNNEVVVNNEDYSEALVAFGVTDDLADGIEAMTTYANEVTGESDTTLSDAVRTLADGYGGSEPDYDDVTLPAEYQRVEYIESTGTQYITIPIGFYQTDEVHTVCSINTQSSGENSLIICSPYNNSNNRYAICAVRGRNFEVAFGSVATTATGTSVANDGNMHNWEYKNRIFMSVDAMAAIGVGGISFGARATNTRLFYSFSASSSGKLRYYVHKKEDDTGVALYACYRKSDGVIGMYDIDNDVFYTNEGSGTFEKGQDI